MASSVTTTACNAATLVKPTKIVATNVIANCPPGGIPNANVVPCAKRVPTIYLKKILYDPLSFFICLLTMKTKIVQNTC